MALKLYNTLGRKIEIFRPLHGKTARLYTCGPTVYRSQHIGNYRTFIFEDILQRALLTSGFRVKHVMNITDVGHLVADADDGEDKIEREARRTGKTALDIAQFYEKEFLGDLNSLNILLPTKLVRATEHIKEQIALIKTLEKKGYTYRTSDGIYFDTSKLANYGELAGNRHSNMAGARVNIGEKHNKTDFALWKFAEAGVKRQMEWSSPWGVGFPGWHIECSAMSMKYLGKTLDIHCGGADHREIHHPNEIAQSEAATGKTFSRFWMHGAFLRVGKEKMAKSSPETNITLETLSERGFDPLDFRYLTLGTHYRKPLSFSWKALEGARNARLRMSSVVIQKAKSSEKKIKREILEAVQSDLNMPSALALFWKNAPRGISKPTLLWIDRVFGLRMRDALIQKKSVPASIHALAKTREMLRKEKQWDKADAIRKKVENLGFRIDDTPRGPAIHRL